MDDVEAFLEHHGVRGMRWGVRRAQKKAARADKKWQKNIYSIHGAVAIHNNVADQMNNGLLDKLNNNPKFKGKRKKFNERTGEYDLSDKTTRDYINTYQSMTVQATKKAVQEVHGSSPSGQLKADFQKKSGQWQVVVSKNDATHVEEPWEDLVIQVNVDNSGNVIDAYNVKSPQMSQSSDSVVEKFLSHHGISTT